MKQLMTAALVISFCMFANASKSKGQKNTLELKTQDLGKVDFERLVECWREKARKLEQDFPLTVEDLKKASECTYKANEEPVDETEKGVSLNFDDSQALAAVWKGNSAAGECRVAIRTKKDSYKVESGFTNVPVSENTSIRNAFEELVSDAFHCLNASQNQNSDLWTKEYQAKYLKTTTEPVR